MPQPIVQTTSESDVASAGQLVLPSPQPGITPPVSSAGLSSLTQAFALIDSESADVRQRGVTTLSQQRPETVELRRVAEARLIQLLLDPSADVASVAWTTLMKWGETDAVLAGRLDQLSRICRRPRSIASDRRTAGSEEPDAADGGDAVGQGAPSSAALAPELNRASDLALACRAALDGVTTLSTADRVARALRLLEQADLLFTAHRVEMSRELELVLRVLPELVGEGLGPSENKSLVERVRSVTKKAGCVLLSEKTCAYLRYVGGSFELKSRDSQRNHLGSHKVFPTLAAAPDEG